ncbi:hypothetical protein ACJX0J_006606, partial [Zea mays]
EDGVALRPKTAVKTDPELVALLKEGGGGASADRARDFLLTLATCNTIVPIVVDDDDNDSAAAAARLLEYQGESPDEQALVYAAAAYGYTLVERTSGHVTVDVLGSRQRPTKPRRAWHLPASPGRRARDVARVRDPPEACVGGAAVLDQDLFVL